MLPSLGFQEIVLLAVIALVVVGPKDLPLMLRKLGQWTARLRAMANEFRAGFDELARQAELDELRKEVDALRRASPLHDFQREAADLQSEVMRPEVMRPVEPAPVPAPAHALEAPGAAEEGEQPADAPAPSSSHSGAR
jgi:sec-independent protein translocase protein TatB